MTQAVANGVEYIRFHSIFGTDVQIALQMTIPAKTTWSTQIPNYYLNGPTGLVYNRPDGKTGLYLPALVNGDIRSQNESQIIFRSEFIASEAESYYLSFWGHGYKANGFRVRMARFGEDHTFGFPEPGETYFCDIQKKQKVRKPFIHIALLSDKVLEFNTIYFRASDRLLSDKNGLPEIVTFSANAVFIEDGVLVSIRRVKESECPPLLIEDNL